MATKISDIIETVESLAQSSLRDDEGIQLGPENRDVRRCVVCWMAARDALEAAARAGAELVITHESLFYPYNARIRPSEAQAWEKWRTNHRRREVIERSGMTVVRIHGSADSICIFDDFAERLGLGGPVSGEGWHKDLRDSPGRLRRTRGACQVLRQRQCMALDVGCIFAARRYRRTGHGP